MEGLLQKVDAFGFNIQQVEDLFMSFKYLFSR